MTLKADGNFKVTTVSPNIMKLEQYRNQQFVGEIAFKTPYFNGEPLPYLFHDTTNAAVYITIDALNRMQGRETIGGNEYCIPAIGLWFQAMESFVSTFYKIASENARVNGRTIKETKNLLEKFDVVNSYFSNELCERSTLRNRLQDFATFRNAIFHDLTMVNSRTQYAHSLFSPNAEKLNEVDLFQSIVIALHVFAYHKHTFKDLDLMPQIFINHQFESVDVLSDEVLFPAFKDLLARKGLTTDLRFESPTETFAYEIDLPMEHLISYAGPKYPAPCEKQPENCRSVYENVGCG